MQMAKYFVWNWKTTRVLSTSQCLSQPHKTSRISSAGFVWSSFEIKTRFVIEDCFISKSDLLIKVCLFKSMQIILKRAHGSSVSVSPVATAASPGDIITPALRKRTVTANWRPAAVSRCDSFPARTSTSQSCPAIPTRIVYRESNAVARS